MDNKMFCYQCQETKDNTGCTVAGVCGKTAKTANLQDMLVYQTKGLCDITDSLRVEEKKVERNINQLIMHNFFTTITNANFDDEVILNRIIEVIKIKKTLLENLDNKEKLSEAALYNELDAEKLIEKSNSVGVLNSEDEDVRSLRELITYGIKGMAAYLTHANMLGYDDDEISEFLQFALAKTLDDQLKIDELFAITMKTGEFGLKAMQLLDYANTKTFGDPEISNVSIGVRKNPAILI